MAPEVRTNEHGPGERGDSHCTCTDFVRVTKAAAIAAGRWMGQGKQAEAREAASKALRAAMAELPVSAEVVVAPGGSEEAGSFSVGQVLGSGGRRCSVAVDALEGSGILAKGQGGAISVLAVGEPGSITPVPHMYMQKLAVGASAAGNIDIDAPIEDNLKAIARAYGREVGELAVIVLDRPRHEDLVEDIRKAGARIKLIPDGDIMASIAAAVSGTGDHAYIGIGGSTEGVMTAAAMRCLGGEIQGKFWPLSRREIERAREYGIDDIEHTFRTGDLVKGDMIFSATGVSTGDVLRGVDYFHEGARSHTLLMCTRCRMVCFVDTIHLFSEDRSEIKLL